MDHTSGGGGCAWWTAELCVPEVVLLDGVAVVVVVDVSEEDMFVFSTMLVSPFRIPLRSEAVGVDIRSSVLRMTEAATIYDWLVCWIVLDGSFVLVGTAFFAFFLLFLLASARAAVASIKAGLVTCITGPELTHMSISSRIGIGTVPSNSSTHALIAAVAWEVTSDG